jgi:AmpD protein
VRAARTDQLVKDSVRCGPIHGGWLRSARPCPSPHSDLRPRGVALDLIVLHAISLPEGHYGTGHPEALFQGTLDLNAHESFASLKGVRVSAHLLIDRQGALTQFVPFHRRAWHAGASSWRGRTGCNDFSLGIELEGDVQTPFTWAQYGRLAAVLRQLQSVYHIPREHLACHSAIAPKRKADPGPYFSFDVLAQAEASL